METLTHRIREDERTPEQKKTHTTLITATDRCLSGWGGAEGGLSKCAWACEPKHADRVWAWVQGRGEMKYIGIQYGGNWYPNSYKHLHIYAVTDGHPALR